MSRPVFATLVLLALTLMRGALLAPAAAGGVVAAGQNGFSVESADGNVRVQVGLLVHADGRFAGSEQHVADTFALRRVRTSLRGRLTRRFEFNLNPDVAGGTKRWPSG